jgi:chromosomal replication initiator protein
MDTFFDEDVAAQWMRVRGRLQAEFGEAAYRSWLKPMVLQSLDNDTIVIGVPTDFMRDWIEAQYAARLKDLWADENGSVRSVKLVTGGGAVKMDARLQQEVPVAGRTAPANGITLEELSAPLDARYTFDTFVTGKPNELAFAAARRVAESSEVTFNPLFLYGGVGLGKTHLMHAIAWEIGRKSPNRRILYLSAEKFMYQFIRALRFKDTVAFKEQFRSVDVLMIDDFQFISGKDSTQEEFFHTFNALVDQNRQIVISADKSPNDLEGIEERMRSRLGWGLVADLHPTTYELRLGILQSKAERLKVEMPLRVLEFLAHRITSNVRELEGALNRIVAYASLVGRPVTMESAQEVLHDLLRANDRRVTIEEIQKRVAEHFNIKLSEMSSARRSRAVARPRQVAMYLAKQLTQRSLPEIGRKFGGRDHTTVMHAVRKVDELRSSDSTFAEDVELLRRMLEG